MRQPDASPLSPCRPSCTLFGVGADCAGDGGEHPPVKSAIAILLAASFKNIERLVEKKGSAARVSLEALGQAYRTTVFRHRPSGRSRPIADLAFLPERPHAIGDFRGREPHLNRPANTADLVYLEVQLRARRSVLREPDLTGLPAPFVLPDR